MSVRRFRPICQFLEDGTPVAVLAEFHEGYVSGDDYDALRSERDEAVALLREYRIANDERGPMFWCGLNQKADAFFAKVEERK